MWTSLSWPHLSLRSCSHWLLFLRNIPLEGCTCFTRITAHLQSRSAGSGHYIDALFTLIVQQINEFWLIHVGRLDLLPHLRYLRFSQRWCWEWRASLLLSRVPWLFIPDVSKRHSAFVFKGQGNQGFRIYVPSNRPQWSVTTRQTSILSRHCCL